MKRKKLRLPSPALIIATTALVFSMAGTGYAVNQINGKQIKKGTVTGAKLKKNTLTGTQINEAKLGKVPAAANSDSAANAAKLAGLDPAVFAKTSTFAHVFETMNAGDADKTLVTSGDIAVKLRCQSSGGIDELKVYATTATNGALLDSESGNDTVLDTNTAVDNSIIGEGITKTAGLEAHDIGYDDTGFVINADNTHLITLLEGASTKILNRGGHTCLYGATFIVR